MSNESAFERFPEELLVAIVHELIEECKFNGGDFIAHLKALRLSTARFAYLKLLNKTLFSRVKLVATQEHVECIWKADANRIAPFARRVTFLPPPISWALTIVDFQKAVDAQAAAKGQDETSWSNVTPSSAEEGQGSMQITDENQEKYGEYHTRALEFELFMEGPDLLKAWTHALKALSGIHTVRFKCLEQVSRSSWGDMVDRHSETRLYHEDPHLKETEYQRLAAPVGKLVFENGVAALAGAGNTIRQLDIHHASLGSLDVKSILNWEKLDLTQMHTLIFRPYIFDPQRDRTTGQLRIPAVLIDEANEDLNALLKKGSQNLRTFTHHGQIEDRPMAWPDCGAEGFPLPKLQQLKLDECEILPLEFINWFMHMPALQHLELISNKVAGEYMNWDIIYDAIRRHPQGIRLDFDQIITSDATEISINYHTLNDVEERLQREESEDPWDDIDRSLPLYLSKRIEWNDCLEMWH
ncbi:hypothetical protein EJ08DRAFT_648517, partial [Tothia fuscella]